MGVLFERAARFLNAVPETRKKKNYAPVLPVMYINNSKTKD